MDKVAFFSYANYDIGQFITFWKRFRQNIFLFLDCYRYLFISRQFLIPNLEAAFYLEISGNEWKAALNQHSRETNGKLFFLINYSCQAIQRLTFYFPVWRHNDQNK